MKVDWSGLIRGIHNKYLGQEWVKEAAKKRQEICKDCPFSSANVKKTEGITIIRPDEYCTKCGCNIDFKTHDMAQVCPENKWEAILSNEEAAMVEEIIKD